MGILLLGFTRHKKKQRKQQKEGQASLHQEILFDIIILKLHRDDLLSSFQMNTFHSYNVVTLMFLNINSKPDPGYTSWEFISHHLNSQSLLLEYQTKNIGNPMYGLRRGNRLLFMMAMWLGMLPSCVRTELIYPVGFESNILIDSIVFAVIGDYGRAGDPEQDVSVLVKSWSPDFIITTGDNNYQLGELSTIKRNISAYYGDFIYNFDAPPEYRCNGKAFAEAINRFFPSPGNHDAKSRDKLLPYLNFFTLPYKETYYKFVWGPVSFYSLNSVAEDVDEQKNWLMEQLSLSETPFNIVYFHHSPYSPGPHGNSDKMQWDFFSPLVNVVLSGHDHIYARIEKKGEEGLYYIVNGMGGRSLYDCDATPLSEDEFDTFCYDGDFGAIKATATNDKLILEFFAVRNPVYPIDRIVIE